MPDRLGRLFDLFFKLFAFFNLLILNRRPTVFSGSWKLTLVTTGSSLGLITGIGSRAGFFRLRLVARACWLLCLGGGLLCLLDLSAFASRVPHRAERSANCKGRLFDYKPDGNDNRILAEQHRSHCKRAQDDDEPNSEGDPATVRREPNRPCRLVRTRRGCTSTRPFQGVRASSGAAHPPTPRS